MPTSNGNPYVGPRTFQEHDRARFFGREREARELLSLVLAEPLVLFYAQSGAGKSSLINARLHPALRDEGFETLPIGRVSGDLPQGVETVDNIFVYNLILRLDQNQHPPEQFSQTSLSDYLQQRRQALPPAADPPPRALIVDQFEELFTAHVEHWDRREAFFQQLRDTLRQDSLLWVILAMREDFVAQLDPYARILPGRLRTRFYMSRLTQEAALAAIEAPAQEGSRPFAPGVARTLVDNLRQIQVQQKMASHLGEFVEPVQLQVVCYQLWENLQHQPPGPITQQDLEELGDVDTALAQFYERTIVQAVETTGVSENDLRTWLEHRLITESGTRGTTYQGPEQTEGMPNRVVEYLANNHLLRAEARSGGTWYELVHDRLIDPILQSNHKWRLTHPLLQAAQGWAEAGRDSSKLYEGQQLRLALASDWHSLGPLVEEFLNDGQAIQVAREATMLAEKESQRQRELEVARRLAEEAEARRRAEAQHAREVEARAREQANVAAQLRRRALLLTGISLVAAILGGLAAISGWQSRQYARQVFNEHATAEAANSLALTHARQAEAAGTMAIAQQATAQAAEETAIAARQTAEAERSNAVQVRADLAANLESLLTAQAITPSPTPPSTPTPTRTPTFARPLDAVAAAPYTAPATATPNRAATATTNAAAAQLAQIRATQTAIAAMPNFSGRLAIPLKLGNDYRVYLTDFDGQELNGPNPISLNAHQPVFSRDGQWLLVKGSDGLFTTDLQGRSPTLLVERGGALWPAFSPDSREIVFAEQSLANSLFRRSSSGSLSALNINDFPILARNILWADDGRLIFHTCQNWAGRPGECGTWISPAGQLDPVRILVGNDGFAMDVQGDQFVYMSRADGDWEIFLLSLADQSTRQLTDNLTQDGLPAIAPDGRSIAYLSDESGRWALWTIILSGGEKQRRFEIDPQRGTVDLNSWADERMSWTQ